MSVQLVLKNSSVQDKEATAAQLAVGELALNYHSSGPFLQCEDSAGNIWRLGGVVIASTAPSSPSKGAWWLDSDDNHLYFYNGSSWIEIQTGEIVPGDITEGTARQLLQTNAAGNGTEWTSNIDVPGTLDVTGVATFDNNVVITGNLTVNGTTTTIDTTTLVVEDKNIELGVVGTPTDTTADGGGITVKGATDKTLTWVNSTGMWTSNQPLDVAGEVQCDSLDVDGVADISGNVTLHGNLDLQDNDKILLGTGDDLEIFHNGTNSFIKDVGTGDLYIQGDGDLFIQNAAATENKALFRSGGEARFYYDNSQKLATTSGGIDVTGTVEADSLSNGTSNVSVAASGNITVTHSGTNTVTFASSSTWLKGTADAQLKIQDSNSSGDASETGIEFVDSNGAIQGRIGVLSSGNDDLYLGTSQVGGQINFQSGSNQTRLTLNGDGHLVPNGNNLYDLGTSGTQFRNAYFDGTVTCDGLTSDGYATFNGGGEFNTGDVVLNGATAGRLVRWDHSENALEFEDNTKARFGSGNDLEIYHNGTDTYIDNNTGNVIVRNFSDDKNILLQTDNGSGGTTNFVECNGIVGETRLFHYGNRKLATKSTGIDVTGTVTCDGLTCEGNAFINSTSGQLDLKDTNNTGTGAQISITARDSADTAKWQIGQTSTSNENLRVWNYTNAAFEVATNNQVRFIVQGDGHVAPNGTNTYDLGGSSNRWRDIYTQDIDVNATATLQGKVVGIERTATASSFNLNSGNMWTFGAIAVPNPTNQSAGMMGSLRVTAAPTSFASNWKFPGGTYTAPTSFPAVAPFFVQASGTILVGSWTEGIA